MTDGPDDLEARIAALAPHLPPAERARAAAAAREERAAAARLRDWLGREREREGGPDAR
ncbi:MAG: hypothetical protein IT545_07995 [Rhodobacteraceae bacterium]|nr:hypothetical protein [Paracoccaceae bacterium]